jgi:hypothetical protein
MVQKAGSQKKGAARRLPVDVVRAFSVRVPDSTLRKVKAKAQLEGLKLQGVCRQALELWASENVQHQREVLNPFASATSDELRVLNAVVAVLRSGDADMQAILRAVVKRHTRESGGPRTAAAH